MGRASAADVIRVGRMANRASFGAVLLARVVIVASVVIGNGPASAGSPGRPALAIRGHVKQGRLKLRRARKVRSGDDGEWLHFSRRRWVLSGSVLQGKHGEELVLRVHKPFRVEHASVSVQPRAEVEARLAADIEKRRIDSLAPELRDEIAQVFLASIAEVVALDRAGALSFAPEHEPAPEPPELDALASLAAKTAARAGWGVSFRKTIRISRAEVEADGGTVADRFLFLEPQEKQDLARRWRRAVRDLREDGSFANGFRLLHNPEVRLELNLDVAEQGAIDVTLSKVDPTFADLALAVAAANRAASQFWHELTPTDGTLLPPPINIEDFLARIFAEDAIDEQDQGELPAISPRSPPL
jgi:hypothetical protein